MEKSAKNKRAILKYIQALNASENKLQILPEHASDPKLVERFSALEKAFPGFQLLVDEVTAEENRVIVRGRFSGRNEGPLNGLPASHQCFEIPLVIGYRLERERIVDHWLVIDQLALLIQSIG